MTVLTRVLKRCWRSIFRNGISSPEGIRVVCSSSEDEQEPSTEGDDGNGNDDDDEAGAPEEKATRGDAVKYDQL